ncbi:MAG: hypothetical protein EOM50_23255 [Erysipelotrichia bacterium]|nr:hypothetical protein [Erysipelotrichia bacterium]
MRRWIEIFMVCTCLGVSANAAIVKAGVLMCNDADSVRTLVKLDNEGKSTEFIKYYSDMERKKICTQSVATMNLDNLSRQDLSGGVTKVGSLYFATQDIKPSSESSLSSSPSSYSDLYQSKCYSCHGSNASKQALNKSAIIAGWSKERITNALNGYKDGTYGGPMKGVMKPIATGLSEKDIKFIAEKIESFK